jgi:hypothetical protein
MSRSARLQQFTVDEICLAFIALSDLKDHFGDHWPDKVKAAALKACSTVEWDGRNAEVMPFTIVSAGRD